MLILGVPTLNRYDLLHRMLESVLQGTVVPDQIVVIDNGGGLRGRYDDFERVTVLRPTGNMGVAASWNHLLRAHGRSDVVISNDDLTVRADGIERLVGPEERFVLGCGFSLFLWRAGLSDVVGYFDEGFWPAYYEDADMWIRLRRAGVSAGVVHDVVDKHVGSATLKHDARLRRMADASRERFIAKWGRVLPPVWDPGVARSSAGKPTRDVNATPWGL
jgi:GT2 family glycosyltransferase